MFFLIGEEREHFQEMCDLHSQERELERERFVAIEAKKFSTYVRYRLLWPIVCWILGVIALCLTLLYASHAIVLALALYCVILPILSGILLAHFALGIFHRFELPEYLATEIWNKHWKPEHDAIIEVKREDVFQRSYAAQENFIIRQEECSQAQSLFNTKLMNAFERVDDLKPMMARWKVFKRSSPRFAEKSLNCIVTEEAYYTLFPEEFDMLVERIIQESS